MPTTIEQTSVEKMLTPAEVRARLKKDSIILWPYRGRVEEGTVLFVSKSHAAVIWLEGYQSRNDDVPFEEVLSVYDPKGPRHSLAPFSGPGYLTEAGSRWLAEHPPQNPAD